MALINKIFFDANVIVEIALERKNIQTAINSLRNAGEYAYASTLSGHLTVHFGKKHADLAALEQLLSSFTLLSLESIDFTWAFRNRHDDDFEDALQIAVAIRNGCNEFVTFDKKLAKAYGNLPTMKITLL